MKLVIAGGGTGGHLFPGIAVAEEFLARDASNEVLFVGTERGIEARVLPRLGYRLELISAAGVRGKSGIAQMVGLAKFMHGYSQSRQLLKSYRPDLVLGVGGYASAPMVLAARGMQVRRFIHEQNAIPGMTNKILSRVAEKTFISLEEARKFFPEGKTLLTGNPLRRQILDEVVAERPAAADGRFSLLVFGGSQGARSINRALVAALPHLDALRERLAITHQTGESDLAEVREGYEKAGFPAEVVPFIDNMSDAYHRADLVVCRAGATTIAEVTACGKACLFIPFPHATDDHQRRNAEALLKEGACFMLLEHELTGERLAQEIIGLVGNREKLAETGRNARNLARLDAAKVIVDEMLKYRD
ncbi:undecaprenyldiphospho-muramoylpentapeptide beta-N-acetylglucosaminyltransferase [Geomobilimonas luticola]|uniref:UDP-N-acetylglucosamine--N-acetylmuramyl-(pentapeptide) pyrophosphoryl-undecaprenol N-acetylglucosamine transferase n=1 Tax=Geomobilimonas luticola TaxID=1114878 RepID=A0ABS5SDR9_9BACT|nr:undecaprenyldiphospho-muramoylpentapeptide beta-N-acetylglucosaminyltransferase [Geomobilimonas luticola]MBT0653315.1 undecaprenyldiphospho-muramoylpentapeptide beta-N-acetylglucosaminyltransferase [Geomobilimonas luticola]